MGSVGARPLNSPRHIYRSGTQSVHAVPLPYQTVLKARVHSHVNKGVGSVVTTTTGSNSSNFQVTIANQSPDALCASPRMRDSSPGENEVEMEGILVLS